MLTRYRLKGLMKFMEREQWRDCFETVLDDHLGDDLDEVLAEDWGIIFWGCAFEDLLTRDFGCGGGNIVDDYLKRRGWKESARSKAYMKALRVSVMSLYEVSDVVPGKSLMVRDLIRGGDRIAVNEEVATQTLKQWDRIAARVVPVGDDHVLTGGLLCLTWEACEVLFESLLDEFGVDNKDTLSTIPDDDFRDAAFLFTSACLHDVLNKSAPALRTVDGEDLLLHDIRFPLAPGVTQADIAGQLNAVPGLSRTDEDFWNWLEAGDAQDRDSAGDSGTFSFDARMESGARVLGHVELTVGFVRLATVSARRAEAGTALIGRALGERVGSPLTQTRTIEQMMTEGPDSDAERPALDPATAMQVGHGFLDRHYRETLDRPIGMLGHRTPREAAGTPAGRQDVAWWLKYLENQSARDADSDDPDSVYDFGWMWSELGVQDLRR